MSFPLCVITLILLHMTSTSAVYSCQLTRSGLTDTKCRCDDRDTYFNLTCPLNEEGSFDVLANTFDFFEIDCKNQIIQNLTLVPELRRERSDQVDYFGFVDCSMNELDNLTYKIIHTRHIKRMTLKKMKHIIASAFTRFKIDNLYILESPLDTLPNDTIHNLPDLEQIFINDNEITSLPEIFFQYSGKIQSINLGQNKITNIPINLFAGLHNLKSLHLFGNRLTNIEPAIFKSLHNLQVLELMTNQLTELPADAFIHLPKLNDLSLRNNIFRTFPDTLFAFNTQLTRLKLTSNVYLTHLPNTLLANLTELNTLHINFCNLSTLPKNFLQDTINLKELNLEHNVIEILEGGFFNSVKNLTTLNLGFNKLVIMDNTFTGLKNLENLNLQYNSLTNITKNSFRHFKNLTSLDMSNNKLSLEPIHFKGQGFSVFPLLDQLEKLYLQNNEIPCIYTDWVVSFTSLKNLNLAYNNITSLDYSELQFVQDSISVDLTYNKINTIDLSTAESLFIANKNNTKQANIIIDLSGNPINCDCRIYDLVRYIDGSMSEEVRKTLKLQVDNIMCQTAKRYIGTPLRQLKSQSLTCVLDDGPKLPANCSRNLARHYQFRQYDKRLIMNCSNTGMTELPDIDFRNNIRFKSFEIEVFLQGNNITKLSKPTNGYDNVIELDLSNNNISEITWIPPTIEVLKLDNNNLTYLSNEELSLLNKSTIRNLTFHNNPWRCDCNLINFTKYLQENFKKIFNLHDITCDEKLHRELTRLSSEDLCPNNLGLVALICGLLAFWFLVMTIIVVLYYRYKLQIKVWLFAHNLCLYIITEDEFDQDKTYDAFISFSHEDEDFVVGKLLPGLEQGPQNYKLCVHFRDWQPGEFITTNIARSIDESRRTVVVLSPGFLRSEWGKMEFRTAHTEALKEGRTRVIVIMYGDIGPVDDLDPELRAYLTTNTYIKWGTPWFWDNLRYTLPHSSKHLKSIKNISSGSIYNLSEKKSHSFGDKVDLIHEPSTPPAATTPPADSTRHLNDPLLHSALNVTLVDGTLINNTPDKLSANNNRTKTIV